MRKKYIVTFGGLGLLPAMPGTYASLAAAIIFYLVAKFAAPQAMIIMAVATVLVTILAALTYPWARRLFAHDDPRQFVLDEVAGQWLTLLFMPADHLGACVAVGFFLFRAFDVAKPFPIGRIEKIRGWAGVVLDDIMAGIYAGIGLRILVYLAAVIVGPQAG